MVERHGTLANQEEHAIKRYFLSQATASFRGLPVGGPVPRVSGLAPRGDALRFAGSDMGSLVLRMLWLHFTCRVRTAQVLAYASVLHCCLRLCSLQACRISFRALNKDTKADTDCAHDAMLQRARCHFRFAEASAGMQASKNRQTHPCPCLEVRPGSRSNLHKTSGSRMLQKSR